MTKTWLHSILHEDSKEVDERLIDYAKQNCTNKTKVMVVVLVYYFISTEDVPLSGRVVNLEKKVAALEALVKQINIGNTGSKFDLLMT